MKFDSHIHLSELNKYSDIKDELKALDGGSCITSCHSNEEYAFAKKLQDTYSKSTILISYGIHPMNIDRSELPRLTELAQSGKIDAIGEYGFDFYDRENSACADLQSETFIFQTELAIKHNLPLILHVRKGMQEIFAQMTLLRKVKAVIFHCYPGTLDDTESILDRGVNAFFSFGTSLIKGNKKAERNFLKTPIERLLLETDAPYQPPHQKLHSSLSDLNLIYEKAATIRNLDIESIENQIKENFRKLF